MIVIFRRQKVVLPCPHSLLSSSAAVALSAHLRSASVVELMLGDDESSYSMWKIRGSLLASISKISLEAAELEHEERD